MADRTPFRTGLTIDLPAPTELATTFLTEEINLPKSKRKVFGIVMGDEFDLGAWQVEKIYTVREDAGYDQLYVTLRRVLM